MDINKKRLSIITANKLGAVAADRIIVTGGGVAFLDRGALKQTLETLNPESEVDIDDGLSNVTGFNGK